MKRRKSRLPILALALAGVSAALAAYWPFNLSHDLEWQRFWRKSYARLGLTLPGTPDLGALDGRLREAGLSLGSPILIRIFKEEFELELWLLKDGRFHKFATYPICRWSGVLGPKHRRGDGQAPEGFYAVDAKALNPNSRWRRSFNLGFPNAFDRAHARTGDFLMVHGGCSSVGCYAMTNGVIDEIWRVVTAAIEGGQKAFQVQAYPFRFTPANLRRRAADPRMPFWRQLEDGHGVFETAFLPPRVGVCERRYVFEPGGAGGDAAAFACPAERKVTRDGGKPSG